MTGRAYKTFIEQTLHYFNRAHEGPATALIEGPAAWRGSGLPSLEEMTCVLSASEIEEVSAAVHRLEEGARPTEELIAADFPLPLLSSHFERWRDELRSGRGFQIIRGIPVGRWSRSQAERFFWCFGLHLGIPGAQNPEGHLLGHVTDTGAAGEDPAARLYKTAANIDYHCDAADVVGLLCLNAAKSGGQSRIVSSLSVFNTLLERRPDLAARLFEPLRLDIRDREVNSAGSHLPVQPCCYAGGVLRTFYHADYFRSVTRHSDVPPLTALERELLDTYEDIAMDPDLYLDMELQPGDIQLLSNHSILHARTAYVDHEEPARRRHLLRLWLSL